MSKVLLLGLTILFSAVFLIIPNDLTTREMFPFSDMKITYQTWVYFIFEHCTVMALSYAVAAESKTYRLTCRTFFWLQVADFADYLLTYNMVWFHLGLLPISMNVVKVVAFIWVALYEHIRETRY